MSAQKRPGREDGTRRQAPDALLVVFVVALLMLAVGRWGFGSDPAVRRRGEAPSAHPVVSGGEARCPPGYPFRVYEVSSFYYPPTHPALARIPGPLEQCFSSSRAASQRGYSPAPPPTRVEGKIIEGTYLVPTTDPLPNQCRRAADRLGFAVPCPTLVPTAAVTPSGSEEFRCDRGFLISKDCTYKGTFFLDGRTFVFHATAATHKVGIGHIVITARRQQRRPFPADVLAPVRCPPHPVARGRTVHGTPATVLRCTDESGREDGAIIVLRWMRKGIVYEVGVQGHGPANEPLALAIARRVQFSEAPLLHESD